MKKNVTVVIDFEPELLTAAKQRAASLGLTLDEYAGRLLGCDAAKGKRTKTVTIDLTDAQHERLVRAAAYVGNGTTVQELVIGSALAHLDNWGSEHKDIRDGLRHDVTFYARKHHSEPRVIGEEGLDYCVGATKADDLPADVEAGIASACRKTGLTRPKVIRHAVATFLKTHKTPSAVRAAVARMLPQKQSASPA